MGAIVALACLFPAGAASAAGPVPAASETAFPTVAPSGGSKANGTGQAADSASGSTDQGGASRAAACPFTQYADNVHISSSAFEASGHGYWTTTNTPSCQARTATITVQLQQYYSDNSWRNAAAKGKATGVRPGGGAGRRATGRAKCYTSTQVTWRSIVDVDIEGYVDGSTVAVARANTIGCRY